MKTKHFISVIIIFFSFQYNYGQEKAIEEQLESCINKNINEQTNCKKSVDFYEISEQLESILLENGIIKNISKKEYQDLMFAISDNQKDYKSIYCAFVKLMDEKMFPFDHINTNLSVFGKCQKLISDSNKFKKEEVIITQGKLLNELMNFGYEDKTILRKLFNNLSDDNFDKLVYRAPIILLIAQNLKNHYNPYVKELNKFKEGKKLFPDR